MVRIHPSLPEMPLSTAAWEWLKRYGVTIEVKNPASTSGGGFWYPGERKIELFTAQLEAAIHELSHAWYQERRKDLKWRASFLAAVKRLAEYPDPRFREVSRLAWVYEHGDRTTGFPGMADNDEERYAGLASGVGGHLNRLPSFLRPFYADLFDQ